jgi:hypothetical protein
VSIPSFILSPNPQLDRVLRQTFGEAQNPLDQYDNQNETNTQTVTASFCTPKFSFNILHIGLHHSLLRPSGAIKMAIHH